MRDLINNIGVVQALSQATLTSTTNSAAFDLLGFESAGFVISIGALTGTVTVKIQDSDTTADADFNDSFYEYSPQGDYAITLSANSLIKLGYWGFKRYIRLVFTVSSGASVVASAILIKGHPHERPVS